MRPLTRFPLHPLLLAVYAVLFLYAENLEEVLLVDAAAPLSRSVVAAAVLLAALGLAYRDARRGALVASALIVAFFGYGHVAGLVAGLRIDDRVQLTAWGLVVLAAIVGAARARDSLPRLTSGLNGLALVLVGLTLVTIVPFELERGARRSVVPAGAVDTGVGATDGGTTRDIWYLVFDRYGSAEAIERRFGLTGNDLPAWLVERGFQVPADSRASYRATDFSLASTLNLRHLDELHVRVLRLGLLLADVHEQRRDADRHEGEDAGHERDEEWAIVLRLLVGGHVRCSFLSLSVRMREQDVISGDGRWTDGNGRTRRRARARRPRRAARGIGGNWPRPRRCSPAAP